MCENERIKDQKKTILIRPRNDDKGLSLGSSNENEEGTDK